MASRKKILVFEDERELAEMIRARLVKEGYEVILAYDGEEGFKKAKELKPDLITLDLKLPKLDGYKICENLKDDEDYENIPIIMLTARGSEIERKAGMAAGADAYIIKPYEAKEFIATIKNLLND